MVRFLIFILFLFLENLFLPALIGPSQLFITVIFILALLIYGDGLKALLYQVIPFALIAEFFAGENWGHLVIPLGITGLIYIIINIFIDFGQNLKQKKKSFSNFMIGIFTLIVFNCVYVGLFIFLNTSYSFNASWYEFTIFFKSSLLSLVGWSVVISVLFQYVPKTK